MSVYISPNLTKKKTDYKPSDKITIYLNYYFQGKKLRIPSDVQFYLKIGIKIGNKEENLIQY